MLQLYLGQEYDPRFGTFPIFLSGDDGVFNAGSSGASMNDSGAGRLEPIYFQTFRWLFGGVTFRTEGMCLLLPVPALYWRIPIVLKDVRIKNRGDVVLSWGQYNPILTKHPNVIED
jgi:hypothetical protein